MKLLHVALTRSDRSSGVAVYTRELLRALVADGSLRVGLMPSRAGLDPKGLDRIAGCALFEAPRGPHLNPWRPPAGALGVAERAFGRPDLVHFHGVYDPLHCALARGLRKRGIPYLVSSHGGLMPRAQAQSRLKKATANLLFFDAYLRGAAALFATSPAEREAASAAFPAQRVLLHVNAPAPEFAAAAASLPEPSPRPGRPLVVGYLGRLQVAHKGLDLLLQAVARLQAGPGPELRFELVGPFDTPEDERALRHLRATLPRPESVVFAGPRHGEAKLEALRGFDLFVHTSRYEGMPAAILEAMSAARPVVLTPGTNLQEAAHAGAGWTCDGDPTSIAEALAAAAADPASIALRGRAARAWVVANMSWERIARDYVRDVRALLG